MVIKNEYLKAHQPKQLSHLFLVDCECCGMVLYQLVAERQSDSRVILFVVSQPSAPRFCRLKHIRLTLMHTENLGSPPKKNSHL